MPEKKQTGMLTGRNVQLGDRHAVRVLAKEGESDGLYVQFLSPVKNTDFGEDGESVFPRASAVVEDGACLTQIALSLDAAYALRRLLNEILP